MHSSLVAELPSLRETPLAPGGAPAALAVSLVGDFNGWDVRRHPCQRNADGSFEVFVPDSDGSALNPGSRYKVLVRVRTEDGGDEWVPRVPASAVCSDIYDTHSYFRVHVDT